MSDENKMGKVGYEAYKASTGGKTYDGRDMPSWEDIEKNTPHVAKAWEAAGLAIGKACTRNLLTIVKDEIAELEADMDRP